MKHLHETFTDQEFEQLQQRKKFTKLNWHDYIIVSSEVWKRVMDLAQDPNFKIRFRNGHLEIEREEVKTE